MNTKNTNLGIRMKVQPVTPLSIM